MKTNMILKITGLIFLIPLFTSCFDNEVDLTAYGDAYILVEMNGQDTLKGLGLHAYSYSEFKSVSVTVPGNVSDPYLLSPYLDYHQDFIYTTPLTQYSKTLPVAGDYVFSAIFTDNNSLMFSDKLTSDFIAPPKIKSCSFIKANEHVVVEWNEVKNAGAYNVKLLDQSGKILFVSPVYSSSTVNYTFGTTTKGWQSTTSYPAENQVVKVEVAAYLLEASLEQNELQCISKSGAEIVWGK
jgi:hypothetical protein